MKPHDIVDPAEERVANRAAAQAMDFPPPVWGIHTDLHHGSCARPLYAALGLARRRQRDPAVYTARMNGSCNAG